MQHQSATDQLIPIVDNQIFGRYCYPSNSHNVIIENTNHQNYIKTIVDGCKLPMQILSPILKSKPEKDDDEDLICFLVTITNIQKLNNKSLSFSMICQQKVKAINIQNDPENNLLYLAGYDDYPDLPVKDTKVLKQKFDEAITAYSKLYSLEYSLSPQIFLPVKFPFETETEHISKCLFCLVLLYNLRIFSNFKDETRWNHHLVCQDLEARLDNFLLQIDAKTLLK